MSTHSFDIEEAVEHGVEKAILLFNMRFWLIKNAANKKHIHEVDGVKYYWTYNSSVAFSKLFPYMKQGSIKRWLCELEEDGIIISSTFNEKNYDKTKWYTIPVEFALPIEEQDQSLAQNGPSMAQNGQPIPDINTDINLNTLAVAIAPAGSLLKKDTETPENKEINKKIPLIIKAFEEIDLKNKSYYNNKTQIKNCKLLIESYGFENVMSQIAEYLVIKNEPYIPTITSPLELFSKWTSLQKNKLNIKPSFNHPIHGKLPYVLTEGKVVKLRSTTGIIKHPVIFRDSFCDVLEYPDGKLIIKDSSGFYEYETYTPEHNSQ